MSSGSGGSTLKGCLPVSRTMAGWRLTQRSGFDASFGSGTGYSSGALAWGFMAFLAGGRHIAGCSAAAGGYQSVSYQPMVVRDKGGLAELCRVKREPAWLSQFVI